MGIQAIEKMMQGNYFIGFEVAEFLHEERTPYQKINFYRTPSHGVLFMIDDVVMLTERDEYVYHEMIAHVPLFSHPNPQRILIIGGGDLGTLRECLKHPGIEEVFVSEIDDRVIELSRKYLPWAEAAAVAPQTRLQVGDGFQFLADHAGKDTFDIIIVDCTDAIGTEAQPQASQLFTPEFFTLLKNALSQDGIVVSQFESAFWNVPFIAEKTTLLRQYFKLAQPYVGAVTTYPSGLWAFYAASNTIDPRKNFRQADYETQASGMALKYYNEEIHRACFAIPTQLREAVRQSLATTT